MRDGAMASPSTLCRFERKSTPSEALALHGVLLGQFVAAHPVAPKRVVLDFDATDIALHGMQEGRHCHGHCRSYCCLPLHVFSGRHLLAAVLQPSDRDAACRAGAVLKLLVDALRADCPDALFYDIVALPFGRLDERVSGIVAWRDALLQGQLPPADVWPHEALSGVRDVLDRLGIARFCKEQPDLVDELLADVLKAFHDRALSLEDLPTRLRELADRRQALYVAEGNEPGAEEDQLTPLRRDLERNATQRLARTDAALVNAWEERVRAWAAVAEVFGDLGTLLGRGWDLTLGILRHVGWREVVALQQLLEQLPQLREIVQSLGRLQATDSQETDESVTDRLFGPVRRLEEELRSTRAPLVPEETKGIELSDVIPRMLPSEAAMLGQPVLKHLWHARRADAARWRGVESAVGEGSRNQVPRGADREPGRHRAGGDLRPGA